MDHQHMQAAQQPVQYYQLQEPPHEKAIPSQYPRPTYEPYQPQHSDVNALPASSPEPRTVGVRRGIALTALAAVVFLLIAVIGLSAGLGVSQRDLHQAKADLATVQAALSAAAVGASPTAPAAPTSTTGGPPAASTTAVANDIECPRVNGTVYTASTGGKRFRRMCGVDYGGAGEAVDIGSVKTLSLDTCIDACASRSNCTGAGWGVIDGDQGPTHSCWMKTNLTKSHTATPEWGFAILVPATKGQ